MAVDDVLISKLEKLAKLNLDQEERTDIAKDLEKILTMVDKLSEVDTEGVEPLVYMHEEVNVLRGDKVDHMIEREEGLKNAPNRQGNYFAVPKIIQK